MERLTSEENGEYRLILPDHTDGDMSKFNSELEKAIDRGINKLGRYEDFEQYFGIDFLTFVKSLVKGVYVKTDEGIINYKNSVGWIWKIGQNDTYVDTERPGEFYFAIIYGHDYYYYLKDYGKTWALTEEELQ